MRNVYSQTLLEDMDRQKSLPVPLVKQAAQEILFLIRDGLVRDGVVNISQFGTFRLKQVSARQGINPQTREPITIAAHQRVIFSPSKALRELIQPLPTTEAPEQTEKTEKPSAILSPPDAHSPLETEKGTLETPAPTEFGAISPYGSSAEVIESDYQGKPMPLPIADAPTNPVSEPQLAEVTDSTLLNRAIETPSEHLPLTESGEKTDSVVESDSIDLGELPGKPSSPSSKRKYFIGAALLLALITVSLTQLEDSSPKNQATPRVSLAGVQPETLSSPKSSALDSNPSEEKSFIADPQKPFPTAPVATQKAEPPVAKEMESSETDPIKNGSTDAIDKTQTVSLNDESPVGKTTLEDAMIVSTESPSTTGFSFNEQTHRVNNGESLWRLARRHYQDPLLWPLIFQANAAAMTNPNHLPEGSRITLPTLQGSPDNLTKDDKRRIAKGYYLTYLYLRKAREKEARFALTQAKRFDKNVVEENGTLLPQSES